MSNTNPLIDQYIANAEAFARPVLTHFRHLAHQACPDIQESIKWRVPVFEYKGIVCNMAAFQQHCSIGFWRASLLKQSSAFINITNSGLGNFGKIVSSEGLPSDDFLIACVRDAVELNERGIKVNKAGKTPIVVVVPDELQVALDKNAQAKLTFEGFSPSYQRDYAEWISSAKTEATRTKRLVTAIVWLEEGKRKNWKYEKR